VSKIPSKELIESVHRFPGPYTFKAIGLSDQYFVARVVAAVREEMEYETDPPVETRSTADGRHVSVTVELFFENADRILLIYERLLTVPGLVLLF